MVVWKCKMCGGDLTVIEGSRVCECEFCGTRQTIPSVHDEGLQTLFNRANTLRMRSEFDKAAEIYEKILQRSETEAEAYWGLILCKYGIEYVEDPVTYKRVPTCHRASYESVTADEDYKNALYYADTAQRGIYEAQAKEIDEIQRGILALAQKEDPYDVFICYKETDESGKRTQDSVIANEIYYQLTREGFKVFFAAITLEDKLGKEYEPYIFSALNTAKVMLVIGTRPEYFNAVWVKNEWSRFLKLMKKDRTKLLIPCYRDMDAYDLPEEFSHLQAQDMSKIGFINDVVRGIKKVVIKETAAPFVQKAVTQNNSSGGASAFVKRGMIALEDKEWDKADSFFEEALNQEPESAEAYLGKLLLKNRQPNLEALFNHYKEEYKHAGIQRVKAGQEDNDHINAAVQKYSIDGYLDREAILRQYQYDLGFDSYLQSRRIQKSKLQKELESERNLTRALQYAKGETKKKLENELSELNRILDERITLAKKTDENSISKVKSNYAAFLIQADKEVQALAEQAEQRRNLDYTQAITAMNAATDITSFEKAKTVFDSLKGYQESGGYSEYCQKEIDRLTEENRKEIERQYAIQRKQEEISRKKKKSIIGIVTAVLVLCVVAFVIIRTTVIPSNKYKSAIAMRENGDYAGAYEILMGLNGYKDSAELAASIREENPYVTVMVAKPGEIVTFGSYEQDASTSNGKEAITWKVLAKEDNRILLISEYGLDSQPYDTSRENGTWQTCSLRKWLNSYFISSAFTGEEQSLIETSTVTADKNPEYNTDPGKDTQDKIFLLSIQEAQQYFNSDAERLAKATPYTLGKGVYVNDVTNGSNWWLRSPGQEPYTAAFGVHDGGIGLYGIYVDGYSPIVKQKYEYMIRPAMWVKIN